MPSNLGYVPGPLVIPQTCEVKLHWRLANFKQASNVFHAIIPDGFALDETVPTGIMDEITASAGWADLNPFLSTETSLQSVEAKDLRAANLGGYISTSATITGTSAADSLPEGVALVVGLRTAQSGRSFRGRVYIPGFSTDALAADGRAAATVAGSAAEFVQAVKDAMSVVGLEMCIAHRGHAEYVSPSTGQTVPAEGAGSVVVTQVRNTDGIFDSQRRRK